MSKIPVASQLLLLLALVASPVFAEPLVFWGENQGVGDIAPATLTFQLLKAGSPSTIVTAGGIPNVEETNTLISWTIDESNAVNYGFDWTLAQANIIGPERRLLKVGFNGHGVSGPLLRESGKQLVAFDMDRLEIDLVRYLGPNSVNIQWRLYGNGILVPEPSTITGLLLAFLLCPLGRRR